MGFGLTCSMSGVAFGAEQGVQSGSVTMVKNQHAQFSKPKMSAGFFRPHITIENDTAHVLIINTDDQIYTMNTSDIMDFTYGLFSSDSPAITIITNDGEVIYNDTVPDETYVHIKTLDNGSYDDYLVLLENMH